MLYDTVSLGVSPYLKDLFSHSSEQRHLLKAWVDSDLFEIVHLNLDLKGLFFRWRIKFSARR